MNQLKDIKCFLLDMDGTIYLGDNVIDGAIDFIETIKKQDKKYIFLTNNSSKNKSEYEKKLKRLGFDATEDDVYSSGDATVHYIKSQKKDAKIFLLGTKALEDEFIKAGFTLVRERNQEIDFVILGFDTTLTYEKLWIACDYIKSGVKYIATHGDLVCPLEDEKTMPDAGAMIELIKAATNGHEPLIIGKPEKSIIEAVMHQYNVKRDELAMVGDRLYTDIKVGEKAGITSILVYSGETTKEMYDNSDVEASYEFESIKELLKEIE